MKRASSDVVDIDEKKAEREAWRAFDAINIDVNQQRFSSVSLMKEDDGASWVTTTRLPPELMPDAHQLAALWLLKPSERSTIRMAGKPVLVPRYNQSYGQAYTFSGTRHEARVIPLLLQPYLDFANACCATMLKRDYGGRRFNMIFVNWYEDGQHYIGWHSDDETQLYKNRYGETLVFSISLGQQRRFLLKPRPPPKSSSSSSSSSSDGKQTKRSKGPKPQCFDLASGDCLVMGGLCQSHYKHSVPKVTSSNNNNKKHLMGGRINMTFRLFK